MWKIVHKLPSMSWRADRSYGLSSRTNKNGTIAFHKIYPHMKSNDSTHVPPNYELRRIPNGLRQPSLLPIAISPSGPWTMAFSGSSGQHGLVRLVSDDQATVVFLSLSDFLSRAMKL